MITINSIDIKGMLFTAVRLELPKTNVFIIMNEIGYVMCATFDLLYLNENWSTEQIVAGRVVHSHSIEELLHAPLQYVTDGAKKHGWHVGMICRDALLKIA